MSGNAGKERETLGEFEIIKEYFAPLATSPAALSLLDDAALLAVPEGQELVVTTDLITENVHFLPGDPPECVAHKALAVSLSDLAAKGSRPIAYLLTLALPAPPEREWLASFAEGLRHLQEETGIALVGGDTSSTKGALTVSVTALGLVPQGEAVMRRGAVAGDSLCVSGTIGDAALGLKLLRNPSLAAQWDLSEAETEFLVERYRRPQARVALAPVLRHCARAAIDVSDGLASDAAKLCKVSGVGAQIEAARVPLSGAAAKAVAASPTLLPELLAAGDDYEILAAMEVSHTEAFAAEAEGHGIGITVIGEVRAGKGEVTVVDGEGRALRLGRGGFEHFE
jgi:thiamine-monophosphate kinase